MKIALITTNQIDIGIRAISGILKDAGYETVLINLSSREDFYPIVYPQTIKEALRPLIEQCDIVGISVSDLFFKRAQDLAAWIKTTLGKKVVLGGIHAQLYPEECISSSGVDAICIGEGIRTIRSLIDAPDWEEICIDDFWIKGNDGCVRKGNVLPMLAPDEMRAVPLPDYTYDDYWLLNQKQLSIDLIKNSGGCFHIEQHQIGHPDSFVASFMFGCTNKCSYCNITALTVKWHKDCPQNKRYRIKPNDIIIKELDLIKENNPNMKFCCIMDNDFTARTVDEIREFFSYFKKNIGVPVYLMVSPNTLTEEKLALMVEGGLKEINLGIQTNEETNSSMYDRPISDALIIEKANLINIYADHIYPFYDILIFNKNESIESLLKTISLIKNLPRPFDLVPHFLTLGYAVPLYKTFNCNDNRTSSASPDKLATSNYHNFDFNEYSSWDNCYLNLIIKFMEGSHTEQRYGKLPRLTTELLANRVV